MRLYLVRHGEAGPSTGDAERHLTEEGVRQARRIHDFLAPLAVSVGAIWHSTKTRARETAEIIAPAVTLREGIAELKGLAPTDPIGPIRKEIERSVDDLMIVGHLPFMGLLTAALVTDNEFLGVAAFEEAATVCLERTDEGLWTIRWMVTPCVLP